MIRILVVDDHPVVREGLIAVLEDQQGFTVVGLAGAAETALDLARQLRPHVTLLDLEMPGAGGLNIISALTELVPSVRVVVFTAYDTDERVFAALRDGARGYLLKGASAAEIARGVRVVHAGGSQLEPRIAERLVSHIGSSRAFAPVLTEREMEVLHHVAEGRPNKQIANALGIAESTVKFHLTSVFRKLGADNRAQAVALASQRGML